MGRKKCWACDAMRNGVKSRVAFEHTCGLERGAIPPNEYDDDKQFQAWLDRTNMRSSGIRERVKYKMFLNQLKRG